MTIGINIENNSCKKLVVDLGNGVTINPAQELTFLKVLFLIKSQNINPGFLLKNHK